MSRADAAPESIRARPTVWAAGESGASVCAPMTRTPSCPRTIEGLVASAASSWQVRFMGPRHQSHRRHPASRSPIVVVVVLAAGQLGSAQTARRILTFSIRIETTWPNGTNCAGRDMSWIFYPGYLDRRAPDPQEQNVQLWVGRAGRPRSRLLDYGAAGGRREIAI